MNNENTQDRKEINVNEANSTSASRNELLFALVWRDTITRHVIMVEDFTCPEEAALYWANSRQENMKFIAIVSQQNECHSIRKAHLLLTF